MKNIFLLILLLNCFFTVYTQTDSDGDGFDNTVDCDDNNPSISTSAVAGNFTLSNQMPCVNEDVMFNLNGVAGSTIEWIYSYNGQDWIGNIPAGSNNPNYTFSYPAEGSLYIAAVVYHNTCFSDTSNINSMQVFLNHDWYEDIDFDGYGKPAPITVTCHILAGYTSNGNDCDDNNSGIYPGAIEVPNNGIDEDCDGSDYYVANDYDGDGFNSDFDCDDNNASIYPGAGEIPNNGIDEDCDGSDYYSNYDYDGDGSDSNIDCDDYNSAVYPGASEICDGIDNNCDGSIDEGLMVVYYVDNDLDGFGGGWAGEFCTSPGTGYTQDFSDCDDSNAAIHPAMSEICDNLDNNCNGIFDEGLSTITYYFDNDGDNYGGDLAGNYCNDPGIGFTIDFQDCDDTDASSYPGAEDSCPDGIDQDCDGFDGPNMLPHCDYWMDEDQDGYGFGEIQNLPCGCDFEQAYFDAGYIFYNFEEDCNDTIATINPSANEIFDNGIDENCDGLDLLSGLGEDIVEVLKIYPNPGKNTINFDFNGLVSQGTITLNSSIGNLINKTAFSNVTQLTIQTDELEIGAYHISITTEKIIRTIIWIKN